MEAGAGTGVTAERNLRAFEEICFNPRAARWWPERDLQTTVLGHRIAMPLIAAPVGALGVVHPEGEAAVARAAGAAGTIQMVSTFTCTTIEEIAASASGPIFLQLYYPGDREAAAPLIERARKAGCGALVLTVDTAAEPRREHPMRGRVDLANPGWWGVLKLIQQGLAHPVWTTTFLRNRRQRFSAAMVTNQDGKPVDMFEMSTLALKAAPVWDDLPWIHEQWDGPVIIKGILSAEDARRAVDAGAAVIVVSNHGGNILDGLPATIKMLPEIVAAPGVGVPWGAIPDHWEPHGKRVSGPFRAVFPFVCHWVADCRRRCGEWIRLGRRARGEALANPMAGSPLGAAGHPLRLSHPPECGAGERWRCSSAR